MLEQRHTNSLKRSSDRHQMHQAPPPTRGAQDLPDKVGERRLVRSRFPGPTSLLEIAVLEVWRRNELSVRLRGLNPQREDLRPDYLPPHDGHPWGRGIGAMMPFCRAETPQILLSLHRPPAAWGPLPLCLLQASLSY
ncbi:hypothetical protein JZ751_010444 [Albula glossodonta]|uniref:Uncharacterized protein n=1 Tax=Albula glossodonta TaxID=121402 RepID=A0A8T2P800_9TELE|nr:hypothetical protein JZ751_010444 [Albula glossodonta]